MIDVKKIIKYFYIFIFFVFTFFLNTNIALADVSINNQATPVICQKNNSETLISNNKENNSAFIKNENHELQIKGSRNNFSPFVSFSNTKNNNIDIYTINHKNKFNLLKRFGFSSFPKKQILARAP